MAKITEEEAYSLTRFGCKVADTSHLDENGNYKFAVDITYNGLVVGTERNSYIECITNLLRIKTDGAAV